MKDRKTILVSTAFLLAASVAAVFFYFEARNTIELIKSEQASSDEFSRLVQPEQAIKTVRFSELVAAWESYVIIDVREPEEFSEGRIQGALNYRLGELLNNRRARQDLVSRTAGKNRVFYCHDGDRSRLAATTIYNEFGGNNYIMVKGFRQIQDDEAHRRYWEGSTDILPGGKDYKRTPWLKWKDVESDAVIDLTLNNRPPVRHVKGKTIVHAPVLLMSNAQIDAFIGTLGGEPIIALCNSKVSCFSTRIFRYRLEARGLELSGFVRIKEGQ